MLMLMLMPDADADAAAAAVVVVELVKIEQNHWELMDVVDVVDADVDFDETFVVLVYVDL